MKKQGSGRRSINKAGARGWGLGVRRNLESDIFWRLSLSDGKEERIDAAPSYSLGFVDMAPDGKELFWIKLSYRAKLGLIENPFE